MTEQILLLIAVPLLLAFFLPVMAGRCKLTVMLPPLVLAGMLWLLIRIWMENDGHAFSIPLGGFAAPLGIIFYVDQMALLFALSVPALTLLLWPWQSSLSGQARGREMSLYMLLVAACSGLALSGDLFNLFVFYELVAVVSYGLVITRAAAAAYVAAYRYLLLSAMGSVLALLGIAIVYFLTGTLTLAHLASMPETLDSPLALAAFVFMLLGFGVKAELFPVNSWVPEVYLATHRRVAALLAGLVSKLAVLIILKVLLMVFPQSSTSTLLLLLGMAGLIFGELSALRSTDMLRTLSWSSIGQLGLIFIAFSVSGETGMMAGLAIVLHHLLIKPAMFLLAEKWGGRLHALQGAAKTSPLAAALFVLFALSLMGVPPLPGFWAKYLLLSGLAGQADSLSLAAVFVVLIMTVIEATYLFRIIALLYQQRELRQPAPKHRPLDLGLATLIGGVMLVAVWQIQPLSANLQGIAAQAIDKPLIIQTVMQSAGGRP